MPPDTRPALPQAFNAAHAEAYDRSLEPLLPIKHTLHLLLRWHLAGLPDTARILLVGAGTGAEARFLAPIFPGWRFTLVDPSAAMLDVARRHAEAEGFADRCAFHDGLVASLDQGSFDAATSVLVSHFLAAAGDRQAYFADIAQRVKPGGRFFNADLCADVNHPSFAQVMDIWLGLAQMPEERRGMFRGAFGTALAAQGPAEVESMIERAGFSAPIPVFQALLIRGWIATRP